MSTVLKLVDINKRVSNSFRLKDISISLNQGEVFALVGENGSGKTLLMNIIAGSYVPDSGRIYVEGSPVSISTPTDAKKLGITMIHQDSPLFEDFTVAENIFVDNKPYINKSLKILNWNKMYNDCQRLFEKLGFDLDSRQIVKRLNLAQKQLVQIAKAYVYHSKIIIMDEPTSSLTDSESKLLFEIIKELKKDGVSIIYISHRLEEIKHIADRLSVIRDGEIVGTQDVRQMDINDIIHMMSNVDINERYPKLNIRVGKEVLRVKNMYYNHILKGIDFSLRKKEILGIVGLVGSGKTKIARCILGLDKMDQGEIFLEGRKIEIKSPSDAIRAGIGYMTEDKSSEGLFMYMNVTKNITAPNTHKVTNRLLINRFFEKSIASKYVEKLDIKVKSMEDKVAYLSGGNQQKVSIARWIMSCAKIFIFDEPTRGIDIPSKLDVYNLMNELVTKGASIILISSDVDEVMGMCDRIVVLYGGEIAAIIPRHTASREKILYYATGGDSDISFAT